MHGRHDDVRRQLVPELDDVLAEIGLDRHDAVRLEMIVEPDLLAHHGLALGDGLGAEPLADVEDDRLGVVRRHRIVHVAARRRDLGFVGFEVEVEMRERVVLDVARGIAQRIELGEPVDHVAPALDQVHLDELERVLQLRIGERRVSVLLEARRGRDVGHDAAPGAGGGLVGVAGRGAGSAGGDAGSAGGAAPIAGASVIPASTSATWRTSIALPSRCNLPAMFIRQPRSPATSMPAPVAATFAAFLPTIALEMSGYLTQKVPPNPQHTSASRISVRVSPRTLPSSLRGWARTPS